MTESGDIRKTYIDRPGASREDGLFMSSREALYQKTGSCKVEKVPFTLLEWDVATLWQLWGLHGNYWVYVAVTGSIWRL